MNFLLSWECISSILLVDNSPKCRRTHSHQQSQRLLEVSQQSKETHPPAQKPMLGELVKSNFHLCISSAKDPPASKGHTAFAVGGTIEGGNREGKDNYF